MIKIYIFVLKFVYKNQFVYNSVLLLQIAAFIDWSFDLNIDDEGALVQVDQLLKDNFNPKFG